MVWFRGSSLDPHYRPRISTNVFQTIICIAGGLCCLLPLIIYPESHLEDSRLRRSLSALPHRDSAVAVLALIAPILLDIGTEFINSLFKEMEVKSQKKEAVLNNMEQLVFLCGTAIVPITGFLPDTDNWAYIYLCCKQCQFVLSGGAIAISLCRYNTKYWSVRTVNLMLSLLLTASIIQAFTNNYVLLEPPLRTVQSLQILSYGMLFTCQAIFTVCSIRWLSTSLPALLRRSTILRSLKVFRRVVPAHTSYHANESLFFPVVYVVSSVFATLYILALANYYAAAANYSVTAIFFHNLSFFLYVLLITYGSTRMIKQEIVDGLYALIESKKMYVRYISHELRTPLNSACLGLKLVSEDLENSTNSKDTDRYEILLDVKGACRTAVQILDDLLCFDKLESGILEVHKHDVPVIPFITDCVNMFTSQAKEAGVSMSIITPQNDLHDDSSSLILEGDTVYMDKFKMDQVLRNLISNALKFTPRGGSVSVSSSFVPNEKYSLPLRKPSTCLNIHNEQLLLFQCNSTWCKSIFSYWTSYIASNFIYGNVSNIEKKESDVQVDHTGNSMEIIRSNKSNNNNNNNNNNKSNNNNNNNNNNNDIIDGKLIIVVTDTGAGISDENQRRLFHEIVQFNPEILQAGGGSGLGLWITNSLVSMHNGTVRVYSAGEGMGSSFTAEIEMQRKNPLIIPIVTTNIHRTICERTTTFRSGRNKTRRLFVPSENHELHELENIDSTSEILITASCCITDADNSPPIMEHSPSIGTLGLHNGVSTYLYDILVVDDSSLNRKMLCRVLRTSGHHCDEADDGFSAIEKVKLKMLNVNINNNNDMNNNYNNNSNNYNNNSNNNYNFNHSNNNMNDKSNNNDNNNSYNNNNNNNENKRKYYDVILMDFVMPNMDGPTATKMIRDLGYSGYIFGVTGNALDSDVNYFLAQGADSVLAKPFDYSIFIHLMKNT